MGWLLVLLAGVVLAKDSDVGERSCTGGVCVPFYLCQGGEIVDNGDGVIDKRFADNECPDAYVCCKEKRSGCRGECVPFYQCSNEGGKELVNLRSFDDKCPGDLVCCNEPPEEAASCSCVAFYQCLDDGGSNDINLRFSEDKCSGDEVCCVNVRPQENTSVVATSCKGKCVPFGLCPNRASNSGSLDLRAFDDCPSDQVCCESLPDTSVKVPKVCDGKCVPFYQCPGGSPNTGGKDLFNLRSDDGACPGDLVCCKKSPSPSSSCNGTCVPFYQCPQGKQNTGGQGLLNLRSIDDCPNDLVCCEVTPTVTQEPTKVAVPPSSSCKGSCVPFYQCPQGRRNTGGQGLLNLRSIDDCPNDLVCCEATEVSTEPASICDGVCVPFYQCPAGSANTSGKDLLNLRSDDGACSGDLVCCKKSPEPKPPKLCQARCVPSSQCMAAASGLEDLLNWRITNDVCPKPLVCCEKVEIFNANPPPAKWMQWINDINGMKEVGSQPAKYHECALQIDSNGPHVGQREVPWLVTIWSRIEYLGQSRDDYHCVGTVIRPDVVLVPADCVTNAPNSQLYVRSGNYNLKATAGVSKLKVKQILIHPDYNFINGYANIALLTLQSTVQSHSTACLAIHNEHLNEQNCLLVGWSSSDLLRDDAALPHKYHLSVQSCQSSNLLCNTAGNTQFLQNCDSFHGSPLMCSDKSGWKLAGLVTNGSPRCDPNAVPETLIKVNLLQPWIAEQLSPSFVNKPAAPKPSRKYLPVF